MRARHVRAKAAAAVIAVAVALVGLGVSAQPASADVGAYVSRINGLRASEGLPPLQVDGNLNGLAQDWADHLADIGQLAHASDLSSGLGHSGWTKLGENVGTGVSVDSVFNAFLGSPAHYANLTDPAFTHVGVGVAYVGGRHFTVHRFMALRGGGGGGDDAPPPAPAPRRSSPEPTAPPVEANQPEPSPSPEVPVAPVVAPPAEAARVGAVLVALHAADR